MYLLYGREGRPGEGSCCIADCTVGMDQTCNDDPILSSLHGVCNPDHTCTCTVGAGKNPTTGRCL